MGISSSIRRRGPVAGISILAALVLAAPASMAAGPQLSLADGWIRALTPNLPAAGYFTLTNAGDQPAVLVGASSPACATLMLHESTSRGGMERMAMVKTIPVPPHGKVTFRPGGYHLMCMSPSPAVTPGHRVQVTLRFKDGTSLPADFEVFGAKGR